MKKKKPIGSFSPQIINFMKALYRQNIFWKSSMDRRPPILLAEKLKINFNIQKSIVGWLWEFCSRKCITFYFACCQPPWIAKIPEAHREGSKALIILLVVVNFGNYIDACSPKYSIWFKFYRFFSIYSRSIFSGLLILFYRTLIFLLLTFSKT